MLFTICITTRSEPDFQPYGRSAALRESKTMKLRGVFFDFLRIDSYSIFCNERAVGSKFDLSERIHLIES